MTDYRIDVQRADLQADAPVHQAVPYLPAVPQQATAPVPSVTQAPVPVQTVQLPDGRIVAGYAVGGPAAPAPAEKQPERRGGAHPLAVNLALGGVAFGAVCGGLTLLTGVIGALAAFVEQLIILAAVVFGGWIAIQILGSGKGGGVVVNAKKAVFKHNRFQG